MKIAYLGYDALYPCLPALEDAGCTVMEVFTCQTDNKYEFHDKVREFAQQRGLPCHVERITSEDICRLINSGCRALFCAGYFYKVPVDPSLPAVNVHPSLLPVGRGAWPLPCAILRGLSRCGVTLHKMEETLDAGDILIQQEFPISPEDDLETLTQTSCRIGAELCARVAARFEYYWSNALVQGDHEDWGYPQKQDYTITPDTPPDTTNRILRAFYGFDCYLKPEHAPEICIERGRFITVTHSLPFGTPTASPAGAKGYAVNGGIILIPDYEREIS